MTLEQKILSFYNFAYKKEESMLDFLEVILVDKEEKNKEEGNLC